MSDSAQEKATEKQDVPPVPGHQGGPPPPDVAGEPGTEHDGDEATSTQPHHVEPRAGRDE